jgi:type I restriction enzyme S subunit
MPWRIITAVDVAILSANKNTLAPLLFVNILNLPEQLKLVAKHSTGTTRERISKSALSKLPVMLPPLPLQEKFSDIVDSCYRKITFLRKKNNILRQTRDLLLPKLISGELDVSDLDIKTIVVGNG